MPHVFTSAPHRLALLALVALPALAPARAAVRLDDPVYMATVCKAATETLLANNYDFSGQRDPNAVAPSAGMSFAEAYRRFGAAASECRALLSNPRAFVPAAQHAAFEALVQQHSASLTNRKGAAFAFANALGYLDARAGIDQVGSRILQYCPQQHRSQFSCDTAAPGIAESGVLLVEMMDFIIQAHQAPASTGDFPLAADAELDRDRRYYNGTGSHYLVFQSDGNLVVYTEQGQPTWALSNLHVQYQRNQRAIMQADGNFVTYNEIPSATWSSASGGNEHAGLFLRDDGALVIRSVDGREVWTSR